MNLPNQPIQTQTYNELGEVIMKSLGYINTTTWLQNVNFRYSIRGQLLNINNSKLIDDDGVTSNDSNDLFGMQMLYDGTDGNLNGGNGNTALFDGRPSAVKWMSKDASGNKSYERSYVYNYDGVARYTGEIYSERTVTGTGHFSNNVDGFDESGITYDQNGNILTLQRNSSTQGTDSYTQIDNLNYTYSTTQPNQVSTVTDGAGIQYTGAGFRNLTGSATPYAYDPNGNLTNDYYKGLQNGYNVLNRVDKCTVTTGTNQYINYIYDASGQLIRKQEYNNNVLGTTTDYIGGFVYLTQGTGTAALSYFSRPEGRVLVNGSAFTQQFIITDGQGNARISFQNNGSSVAVVKQENSYYGFGLQLLNSPVSLPPKPNKKLYNGGSEWQNDYANGDTNLPDYYQTFNRNYDAAIGRFVQTDPDPESAESMTGYQYAGNMPVMMNDPDGDKVVPGNTYNYNYVSPLAPNTGPLNGAWQDSANFGGPPPAYVDDGSGSPGSNGTAVITNPASIADIFRAVATGNGVIFNLSANGTYSVSYYNAIIDPNNPNNDSGEGGLIAFGNQSGPAGQTATPLNSNSDANQGGNLLSDAWGWIKSHFYASAEGQVTEGPQFDYGVSKAVQLTVIPYAQIKRQARIYNRGEPEIDNSGDAYKSEYGIAAGSGLDYQSTTDAEGYNTKTITAGYGLVAGSYSWQPGGYSKWFVGLDFSLHGAFIIGGSFEIKIGFGN